MWLRQASAARETALECDSVKRTGQVGADPASPGGMPAGVLDLRTQSGGARLERAHRLN